ncbi:unannotated protein [freshwater metagenome]|uniref:Unannotated protein n=1 Tax=freshwater metagenome TaxID=449393 RepID=A0A6J6SCG4_9ZZZZ
MTINQAIETTILSVATITIALSMDAVDIELKAATAGQEIA